jgi:hypothetical protein
MQTVSCRAANTNVELQISMACVLIETHWALHQEKNNR